jgi:hypothetical protein
MPKQKANILNEQFKSVFTTESIDNIPNKGVSPHPDIPPLTITTPGIRKLLDNINPHKASGPDNISGRILTATSCPSFFKGATPLLSVLSDFMKEKSFFGFD